MNDPVHLPHDWFPRPLPANVRMGERSWCYSSFAFQHYRSRRPCGVSIGHDSGIYNGTFFDLGEAGEVIVGDYCTLVGAIFSTDARIEIESYTFVAHEVVFGDQPFCTPPSTRGESQPSRTIRVGQNVWIGARAILLGGSDVGEGAIIGAGAVVDCQVPAFATAVGNPLRIIPSGK